MSKITDYFYIFSKLTTSLVLLIIITMLGYALVNSYKNVDKDVVNLEQRFKSLSDSVLDNNNNFIELNKKNKQIDNKLNEIVKILNENQSTTKQSQYENDINNILNFNKKLQEQIDIIKSNVEVKKNLSELDAQSQSDTQIQSFIKHILFKYKNGENVKDEITYLESIISQNKKYIIEKLNLVIVKRFHGMQNLNNEFNVSLEKYVHHKFANNNKNYILNLLFKFVTVRPSNVKTFKNVELNLLMQGKKFLEAEDIKSCLEQIKQIESHQKFFYQWIEQVEIFLEFKNEIQKVV